MRRLPLSLLALAAAACQPTDPALKVVVELAPEARSPCVVVDVVQDRGVRHSAGVRRDGGSPLVVAVYEDGLGEAAQVQAGGYLEDCATATVPPERSQAVSARFAYPAATVSLRLEVGPDGGVCEGLPRVACEGAVPTCQERLACGDFTCALRPAPAGSACSGGMRCATCDGQGRCGGPAPSCPAPVGNACLVGVCAEPEGCQVEVDPRATCSDGDACTENDACQPDGGCLGTAIACPPPGPCQVAGGCDGGACVYAARTGSCDGGTCNELGQCVPPALTFPYLPSNFTVDQLPPLSPPPLTVSCAATLDTQTADGGVAFSSACGLAAPNLGVLLQGGGSGPSAALLFTGPLQVQAAGSLTVQGARPLIVVVLGDAAFAGPVTVLAGADRDCAAPPFLGSFDGLTPGGGGGGGFGFAGSSGGLFNRGGAGMGTSGNQLLVPLRGGCRGGEGGPTTPGGAGGGALQVSAIGQLTVDGLLGAPGRGGTGGPVTVRGGGGGGSGGGLLLEAVQVTVSAGAALTANGGGGGEGSDAQAGAAGQPGGPGTARAGGGSGSSTCGGSGGQGGARAGGASSGSSPPNGNPCFGSFLLGGGGGGGGGAGRIRLNAVTGCTILGTVSPAPTGC